MVSSGPPQVTLRTPKQVQRRLRPAEIEELVASYQAGGKVNDLAAHYQVNRNTVMGHIDRAGVRRHYPALLPEEIKEAAQLYRSGCSLAAVGVRFGVNASTVRTALLRVGCDAGLPGAGALRDRGPRTHAEIYRLEGSARRQIRPRSRRRAITRSAASSAAMWVVSISRSGISGGS